MTVSAAASCNRRLQDAPDMRKELEFIPICEYSQVWYCVQASSPLNSNKISLAATDRGR